MSNFFSRTSSREADISSPVRSAIAVAGSQQHATAVIHLQRMRARSTWPDFGRRLGLPRVHTSTHQCELAHTGLTAAARVSRALPLATYVSLSITLSPPMDFDLSAQ